MLFKCYPIFAIRIDGAFANRRQLDCSITRLLGRVER